jgi:hypothetical protein
MRVLEKIRTRFVDQSIGVHVECQAAGEEDELLSSE